MLKEYQYDPAKRFSDNTSFLHRFCYFPEIAKEVAKISPDYRFDNGPTPLAAIAMLGCWIGDTPEGVDLASESAKILIDAGADVNAKSEQIIFNDKFAINSYYPNKAHPYAQNNDPMLLVHLACLHSAPSKVVKVLLDNGADISCEQEDNRTHLHNLVLNFIHFPHGFNRRYDWKDEYLNVAKTTDYLLQAGVDINAQDNRGKTVLHYIARRLDNIASPAHTGWLLTLYETLLDKGAEYNIRDNWNKTPEDTVPNKYLKELVKEAQEKQKYNKFIKEYMEQELETFER